MALQPVGDWVWEPITSARLAHKRALLAQRPHEVLAASEPIDAAQRGLLTEVDASACRIDAAGARTLLTATPDLPGRQALASLQTLAAVALAINEDLLVLRRDADDVYRLVAACLCSPSYWRLADKLGQPIQQIHAPVPGLNARLGQRIDDFLRRLPPGRVFERRNWFVHETDTLFQPHHERVLGVPYDALWLRTETQSLRRLSAEEILFSVRIDCWPLASAREVPGAAAGLADALDALDPDQRAGTSITPRIEGLCAHLRDSD